MQMLQTTLIPARFEMHIYIHKKRKKKEKQVLYVKLCLFIQMMTMKTIISNNVSANKPLIILINITSKQLKPVLLKVDPTVLQCLRHLMHIMYSANHSMGLFHWLHLKNFRVSRIEHI